MPITVPRCRGAKVGCEDGEGGGAHQRRPDTLDDAGGDQDSGVRREGAGERGAAEDHQCDHEHAPPAEQVAKLAAGE
jgi:hypothetical protein